MTHPPAHSVRSVVAVTLLLSGLLSRGAQATSPMLVGEAGLGGRFRPGIWVPVTIELDAPSSASARALVVELDGRRWRRELTASGPRRVELAVLVDSAVDRLPVRLEDAAGAEIAHVDLPLAAVDAERELWGAVADLGERWVVAPLGVEIVRQPAERFPADGRSDDALDRLVVSPSRLTSWPRERLDGLRRWLWLGGTVALSRADEGSAVASVAAVTAGCRTDDLGWKCGAGRVLAGPAPPQGRADRLERVTRAWLAGATVVPAAVGEQPAISLLAAVWAALLCLLPWPRRGARRTVLPLVAALVAGAVAGWTVGLLPQGRRLGLSELRVTHVFPGSPETFSVSVGRWRTTEPGRPLLASELGDAVVTTRSAQTVLHLQRADATATVAAPELAQWAELRTLASGWRAVDWREAERRGIVRRAPGDGLTCAEPTDAARATVDFGQASLRAILAANGVPVRAICVDARAALTWRALHRRTSGGAVELVVVHAGGA